MRFDQRFPKYGYFSLAKINDNIYHYDAEDEKKPSNDYRHWRSVTLLTPSGIPYDHKDVTAATQSTLRCRCRIWRVDSIADDIEKLIELAQTGHLDIDDTQSPEQRFDHMLAKTRNHALNILKQTEKGSADVQSTNIYSLDSVYTSSC